MDFVLNIKVCELVNFVDVIGLYWFKANEQQ